MIFLTRVGNRLRFLAALVTSAGAADADKIVATNASGFVDPTTLNATVDSVGVADAAKIVQLGADGLLDPSVMPSGIGADTASIVASEALAAGDLVNVWNDAGTPKVRKADATTEGRETVGFVLAGVASGATATVRFEGRLTGLTGLTPGATQYMSTTPGARTESPASATGNVYQAVGVAVSSTSLDFEPQQPITMA